MAKGQYTRLYHELIDEYPGVWRSDAQLATFVRLLMIADKWWPQWAPRPFGRRTVSFQALVDAGLVLENASNLFSIKGLDRERGGRSEHGKRAAGIRWSNAPGNAQPMPSKAEQNKAEQMNGQSPPQTFMAWKPKDAAHMGQHPGCLVCAPLQSSEKEGTP